MPVIYGMTDVVISGQMNTDLARSAEVPAGEPTGDLAG